MASLLTSLKSSLSSTADTRTSTREATSRYGFLRLAGETCYCGRHRRNPRQHLWLFKRGVVAPGCLLAHMPVMRIKKWERHLVPGILTECSLVHTTLYTAARKGISRCYPLPLISKPGLKTLGSLATLLSGGKGCWDILSQEESNYLCILIFYSTKVLKYGKEVL